MNPEVKSYLLYRPRRTISLSKTSRETDGFWPKVTPAGTDGVRQRFRGRKPRQRTYSPLPQP